MQLNNPVHDKEIYDAYLEIVGKDYFTQEKCEDAYVGSYPTDEDFARETAESIGAIENPNHWPNYCIDWDWASKELMNDYTEHDGHYFHA